MSKYIVKVEMDPNGDCNPEFGPEKKLEEGLPADGYVILTYRDGKPSATLICGVTIMEIAHMIAGDGSEAGSVIRQSIAIAEGLMKAKEIEKNDNAKRAAKNIVDLLSVGRDL